MTKAVTRFFVHSTSGRFVAGLALGLAGMVAFAAPSTGQILRGHNTNAPVNYAADHLELQARADRVIVSGNVVITQGDMRLTAQRVTIAFHQAGGTQVDRIDASGGVVVSRGGESARGSVGIYDFNRKIITLIGNVQLKQGANTLNGGRLVIDLTSGRSSISGSSAGPAVVGDEPPVSSSSGGRVTGSFTVPQRN